MWNLRFIKDDRIFELARISHHHTIANDDVFTNITTAANVTVLANPGRPLQHGALLDDGSGADEHGVANKRFAHELPEDGRF